MRPVFLVGVGATGFGRGDRTGKDLSREAIFAALDDAGLRPSDIPAIALGTGRGALLGNGLPEPKLGGDELDRVGRAYVWAARAMQLAWQAVASGEQDVALVLGTERPVAGVARERLLRSEALAAERYMSASGATAGHFARVAAKNRSQGAANPRALLAERVDESAVMQSDMLVWPLRRLMVAPLAHGAAAAIFASRDVKRRLGLRAPRVRAAVLLGDCDGGRAAMRAALLAYQEAGIGPDELDCAEIDDLTAAGEIATYEALQFAPPGQGPELVDSGFTALHGVLPVNPSGGQLACGDAVGASSILQLCEMAWQLRRRAGSRQVEGARAGLALSSGRGAGGTSVASLMILSST